jgi:hypothetical protein
VSQEKISPEEADSAKYQIKFIRNAILQLQRVLPDEQSYKGSELQRIDALVNALEDKYLREVLDDKQG